MYWILAAIFLLVTLAVPRLRPFALIGCLILAAMLTWAIVQRVSGPDSRQVHERGLPTTPAAIVQPIPIDEIELQNLTLTGGGAPFELTGNVANRSATMRLKMLLLDISRRDCHAGALDPSGCIVRWSGRQRIELSVPPQQERQFSVSIWARAGAPRSVGSVHDEFVVVAANGEPASVNPAR